MEMRISRTNSTNLNNKTSLTDIVTTQMMMSGDPPFRNHSHILIWTDHDQHDLFSLILKRKLVFLQANICPILDECTFR